MNFKEARPRIINDRKETFEQKKPQSSLHLRDATLRSRNILNFVSIMQRIIRKCCNCLAEMKIMRCLYVSFYIFVCLFGNIVTIIFLYKQYHKSQISENKESNTETTTENSNLNDGIVNNITKTIDDWFIDLDSDTEDLFEPSVNNARTKVSLVHINTSYDKYNYIDALYDLLIILLFRALSLKQSVTKK